MSRSKSKKSKVSKPRSQRLPKQLIKRTTVSIETPLTKRLNARRTTTDQKTHISEPAPRLEETLKEHATILADQSAKADQDYIDWVKSFTHEGGIEIPCAAYLQRRGWSTKIGDTEYYSWVKMFEGGKMVALSSDEGQSRDPAAWCFLKLIHDAARLNIANKSASPEAISLACDAFHFGMNYAQWLAQDEMTEGRGRPSTEETFFKALDEAQAKLIKLPESKKARTQVQDLVPTKQRPENAKTEQNLVSKWRTSRNL